MKNIPIVGSDPFMRNVLKVLIFTLVIILLPSCGRKKQPFTTEDELERLGSNYLSSVMIEGESETNLIARFGQPFYEFTTETHQVSLDFWFSKTNRAAANVGVAGVTVFCASNRVVSWDPISVR